MQIIASTGGKGGTGKTTFAILLAFKLVKEGKKVVLCDCDIECPNCYIILNQELKNGDSLFRFFPELDRDKCKKCGLCSKVCKENAILWVRGKFPIFFKEICSCCGACWIVCPNNAIKKKAEEAGKVFYNKINENFWLVTGVSNEKISETGPLVRQVKEKAINLAKRIDADFLIIDTAPGTHCNVIQALMNCDKVYAVTEPTPLGAHDLKLILELIQKLGLKAEIVLNKAGLGKDELIEKIAKQFETKISFRIPYSEDLMKAYSRKELHKVEIL